jgi:hypothetical protein
LSSNLSTRKEKKKNNKKKLSFHRKWLPREGIYLVLMFENWTGIGNQGDEVGNIFMFTSSNVHI